MEKVLQFGEGNFLRGFVDYMLDKLNKSHLFNGKVVVMQPIQNGLAKLLNEQNGEYNLILRSIINGKATAGEIIGFREIAIFKDGVTL